MVWGGMVVMTCISGFVVRGSFCVVQSLWLTIRMVIVCGSSLTAILTQWMASIVVLQSVGKASPTPFHLEDFACPSEPNIMSRLCGELYCVNCMGQVRGDEQYECVIWNEVINVSLFQVEVFDVGFVVGLFLVFFQGVQLRISGLATLLPFRSLVGVVEGSWLYVVDCDV